MAFPFRNQLAPLLLDGYGTLHSKLGKPKPGMEEAYRTKLLRDYLDPLDQREDLHRVCRGLGGFLLPRAPVLVGGVSLPQPFMLAGGWIKGTGYASESDAMAHVDRAESFLPGWRSLPLLAGPVEYGSFNRWPRIARDPSGKETVAGNPGIRAATAFLSLNQPQLPPIYGINISPPPEPGGPDEMKQETVESLAIIFSTDLRPSWITLNLAHIMMDPESSPIIRDLVQAASQSIPPSVPLWFKVSPEMPAPRYRDLLDLSDEWGVRAIIATDVVFQYHADGSPAFVSGKPLAPLARKAQIALATLKRIHGHNVDIVACGGIMSGRDLPGLEPLGIPAWQYHSAVLHRGPLAGPLIWWEAARRR